MAQWIRWQMTVAAAALCLLVCAANVFSGEGPAEKKLNVLFLGDKGHHAPRQRYEQLNNAFADRGITLTYTERMSDLNAANLNGYDCLAVYANIDAIEAEQEKALLDFVAGGKGFAPLHCASYCFRNSNKIVELIGGQFKSHKSGEFDTTIVAPEHPVMKGFEPFKTWDETYVHDKHNPNRTVLQSRVEGDHTEPWTWVRTHEKGRVFYTAYGHDQRTWSAPGFHELIERGLRWASGDDRVYEHVPAWRKRAGMQAKTGLKPFEYVEANVPFYASGGKRTGGDNWNKMQLPVEPAESQRHLVVPEGFEAQLFAAEPEIMKPIAMAWDHKGRLWIAETYDYPNEKQKPGEGRDRIKICEDTNGDGRADKFTVFADKLSIPTSLTFANGGVVVMQAPETLFLKDNDGDDKADEQKVLFTGWGVGDTHAGPSNLKYGFDNWLYGIVGYASFNGDVGGEKAQFGAGFYRFKPDGSKIEYLRSNNNNSWGLGFSEEGYIFGSTANNNPSVYLSIPNRYYERVRGWSCPALSCIADSLQIKPITDRVRQVDCHNNFTAASGHALYTARAYPKEYWNRVAFVNEPTGHVTATFVLEPQGTNFVARSSKNLVASDDEWTSPIVAEVGPDGMVWVIDWYNYIIQHNPTPQGFQNGAGNAYVTPLRDRKHGRIYRIVHKNAKPQPAVTLDPNNGEQLVAALKNDNLFWRLTAQRLLVERKNADVAPALVALVKDKSVDELGLNVGAIHGLWTLHGLGAIGGAENPATIVAAEALLHPSAAVRRTAVSVLPRNALGFALGHAFILRDTSPQVRLAAALAATDMEPIPDVGALLFDALQDNANAEDRWLPDALTSAAAAHDVSFLKASAANKRADIKDRCAGAISRVAEHLARGAKADALPDLITALVKADPATAELIIGGLTLGWPKTAKAQLPAETEKELLTLIARLPIGAQGQLALLASRWGTTVLEKYTAEVTASILAKAQDEKESEDTRLTAVGHLIAMRGSDEAAVKDALKLITPRTAPEFATKLLEVLRQSEAPGAGKIIVDSLKTLAPSARNAALSVLLSRANWTQAFMRGVEEGAAQLSELSLDQKQALAAHPDKTIAAAAKKLLATGGGLPSPDRQKVIDQLSAQVLGKGDVAAGKEVYKANCAKCHQHSGEGNKIGPDLTGMAAHPKQELLIHIFDPSRSVEGNFRVYTVVTNSGQVHVGLLASETKTSVELLDSEGKTHPVQRADIRRMVASDKSLMPEGFEAQVQPKQITDLLEFLTHHGQYVPLDLRKAATICSTKGMFTSEHNEVERLIFPDWTPKTVEGVTFNLIDPEGGKVKNAIMLHGPQGTIPPTMPKAVKLPCNLAARTIHFLSGVSGWGHHGGHVSQSVTMTARLHYADGKTEDHVFKDGVHFADYIRHIDVAGSKLAFKLRDQQLRYFKLLPQRKVAISELELIKGPDNSAPIVMAITVETAE